MSEMKIVLLCGSLAWESVTGEVTRDPRQADTHVCLRCGYKFQFIVSQDDGKVPMRLYLRGPELPANAKSILINSGIRTSECLKLLKVLTGIETIRPFFAESLGAFHKVIAIRSKENAGDPKLTRYTLPASLKSWITRKGFNEEDLRRLEEIAGSDGIIGGLNMVLIFSAERIQFQGKCNPRRASTRRRKTRIYPFEKLDQVEALCNNISNRILKIFKQEHLDQWQRDHTDLDGEDLEEAAIRTETLPANSDTDEIGWDDESRDTAVLDKTVGLLSQYRSKNCPSKTTRRPPIQRLLGLKNWSLQGNTSMVYKTNIRDPSTGSVSVTVCHTCIRVRKDLGIEAGRIVIEIEVSDDAEGHEKPYARRASHEDPARRIAFKMVGSGRNGNAIEHHPQTWSMLKLAKVNALADRLLGGESYEDMVDGRLRRYIFFEAESMSDLPPAHQRYWMGGYTPDMDPYLPKGCNPSDFGRPGGLQK
jgi:hypothetical protein